MRMEDTTKKLIIRFSKADCLKSATLNVMQLFLRFQDYLEHKKETPDGKTILTWFLIILNNEVSLAASISKSQNLVEAQNLVAEVIQKYEISGEHPNFQEIIDILRNAVTKITSEAATAAKDLEF